MPKTNDANLRKLIATMSISATEFKQNKKVKFKLFGPIVAQKCDYIIGISAKFCWKNGPLSIVKSLNSVWYTAHTEVITKPGCLLLVSAANLHDMTGWLDFTCESPNIKKCNRTFSHKAKGLFSWIINFYDFFFSFIINFGVPKENQENINTRAPQFWRNWESQFFGLK